MKIRRNKINFISVKQVIVVMLLVVSSLQICNKLKRCLLLIIYRENYENLMKAWELSSFSCSFNAFLGMDFLINFQTYARGLSVI